MPSSPNYKRKYRQEYDNYHSSAAQRKKRSNRTMARRRLMREGVVAKGDGKDVTHKNGNAKDNSRKNLGVQKASKNRSYKRTKTAGKKNSRD